MKSRYSFLLPASSSQRGEAVDRFRRYVTVLASIFFYIAMAGLILLIALSTVEIFSRYFFNHSFTWVQEFNLFLICWVVFLGFGKVVIEKEDIMLSFFVDRLPLRYYRWIRILNAILLFMTGGFMLYRTIVLIEQQSAKTSLLTGIPYGYYTLPLALVLVVVVCHALILFSEAWSRPPAEMRGGN
jgi:TRAP-type C4-dicarboxylate transport system permease small subunit